MSKRAADSGKATAWYLFDSDKKLVAGPMPTRELLVKTKAAQELRGEKGFPKGTKIFAQPEKTRVITCNVKGSDVCPGLQTLPARGQNYYYLFRYQPDDEENPVPEMTGEDLNLDGTRQDFDPQSSEPIVLMDFTGAGADKFHDITRDLAQEGQIRASRLAAGTPKEAAFGHFAIVLDDEIRSYPSIDYEENPDGIPGDNGAQISGVGNINAAKDLALVLQTGVLPVEFSIESQTTVSATLGDDALKQALTASLAGLVLVAIFLLVIYRFLGLVAVIGLGIYAAFLYAVLVLFDVTLTLPGFAGMVLTIGVAADANIVIFERIKEESRAGKSVRAAISTGYTKGFHTIIDANVVTAITAVILFIVATSGVRGFAFLVLLGTGISIVTAVFVTRALLALLAGFRWFDNPAFMGASPREIPRWQRLDIVGKRRLWFTIAGVLIALSLASIVFKGLNLGIDFEGGSQVSFQTPQPVQISDIRDEAEKVGSGRRDDPGPRRRGRGRRLPGVPDPRRVVRAGRPAAARQRPRERASTRR